MSALTEAIALVLIVRTERDRAMDGYFVDRYEEWRRVRFEADAAAPASLEAAGAVIRTGGPTVAIKFAGIQSTSTCGLGGAIGNWLTSARRKRDAQAGGAQ